MDLKVRPPCPMTDRAASTLITPVEDIVSIILSRLKIRPIIEICVHYNKPSSLHYPLNSVPTCYVTITLM